jgi:ATP-dependent protease HslVU (ClpYQ) peptidase subunit
VQDLGTFTILCGFSGNFAEGLFIRHAFQWPKKPHCMSYIQWLVKNVQPALQKALKSRFEDRKDVPIDWSLLVAIKPGHIFSLSVCGDVEESRLPYAAIGSGASAALGCLYAVSGTMCSWEAAELSLQSAQQFHSSVRSPFHTLALT